jgi:integrase
MYGDGVSIWQDKKTKKWVTQVRVHQEGQKPKPIQKRSDSKRAARQIAIEIRSNETSRAKTSAKGKITFELLLAQYQVQMRGEVKDSTLANYIHLLRLYALPRLAKKQVTAISPEDIIHILNDLRDRGLTNSTINTVRSRLIDVFRFAQHRRFIEHSPTEFIRRQKQIDPSNTQVQAPWTTDETKTAVRAFQGTQLDVFMAFALGLGMRKGEILGLRWSDLDFERDEFHIQRSRGEKRMLNDKGEFTSRVIVAEPKTESSNRVLPLTPEVIASLERLKVRLNGLGIEPGPDDYLVVTEDNKPLSLTTLHRTYTRLTLEAGIRRIRIHDIRHTVAVVALEAGVPLIAVSEAFGHSGIEITRITYAPKVPGLSRQFSTTLSKALAEL